MKYKTIRFEVDRMNRKFTASIEDIGDRENVPTKPNAMGWYHYPETVSDEEAFQKLKECMITRHTEEITQLVASKEALESLEFPKGDKA